MIGKIQQGRDTTGLIYYLFGEGRHNEHTNQRVVAGSGQITEVFGMILPDENGVLAVEDQKLLADRLDEHWQMKRAVEGNRSRPLPRRGRAADHPQVIHAILAVPSEDGDLSDQMWEQIAQDYIDEMGWSGCEWVAVNHGRSVPKRAADATDEHPRSAHGNDHIHIVVNRVQADGRWASTYRAWPRSTRACRTLEDRYKLTRLRAEEPSHQQAPGMPAYSQGEARRARRDGGPGERYILEQKVRVAATAARNEVEFVQALRADKVRVRPRYAAGGTERVVGYSVKLPGDDAIWLGGGQLAKDLTLPKMRERWGAVSPDQARAAWRNETPMKITPTLGDPDKIAAMSRRLLTEWDRLDRSDRAGWSQRAGDVAGWSSALGQHLVDPALMRSARELSRAAQLPPRTPREPRHPGVGAIVRQIMMASSRDSELGWAAVVEALGRAIEAIAEAHRARGELVAAQRLTRTHQDVVAAVDRAARGDERARVMRGQRTLQPLGGPGDQTRTDAQAVEEPTLRPGRDRVQRGRGRAPD